VKRDEAIGGMVLLLFGLVTVILSLRMPLGTFRIAGSGLFPLCLGILLLMLSALYLLSIYFKEKKPSRKKPASELSEPNKQTIFFLGTMVLTTLLLNKLGYPLSSFLLLLSLFRILGLKRWGHNALLSFIVVVASYLLFVEWLKIPLPKGWIGL
jgi:small-conductance mechanosensitive channel